MSRISSIIAGVGKKKKKRQRLRCTTAGCAKQGQDKAFNFMCKAHFQEEVFLTAQHDDQQDSPFVVGILNEE
jgi:hypothetical protein